MTRLIHDKFAKDYLSELLLPLGVVNPGREVSSEVRQIDVYFMPNPGTNDYKQKLGLLGKMAATTALFEPFRNPVNVEEVLSCLSKLLDVKGEIQRLSKRENIRPLETELPTLWILTPTASTTLLNGFRATVDEENWCKGIYWLPEYLRTAIVVIHQLAEVEETLWLRILGRGRVQERAIASLSAMPVDEPLRINTLELVYQLQSNLTRNQSTDLEVEDRELIMAIAPLFQEQIAAAEQRGEQRGRIEGIQQGIERGRREENRAILENFLLVRFGELDPQIRVFIPSLSALNAVEFTRLLVQLSALSLDKNGLKQAKELLAENILRMRFEQLHEPLTNLLPSLLELSPEDLSLLLSELPQLSLEELLRILDSSVS